MNCIRPSMIEMNKYRKVAVSILAAILLSFLYSIIFSFSAQSGEQSGGLSQLVTETCVELINNFSGKNWSRMMMDNLANLVEKPIRKLAHFMEYACMGVLVYVMWRPWKKGRSLYLLVVSWVFVSAAADEIHQLFVPGRYGCMADVVLDTFGGIFGVLICMIIENRKCIRQKT